MSDNTQCKTFIDFVRECEVSLTPVYSANLVAGLCYHQAIEECEGMKSAMGADSSCYDALVCQ